MISARLNNLCIPWKLASQLVHEHDHYLFLSSAGIVGTDAKKADEFQKANWAKTEISAYTSELNFLNNCREKISAFVLQQFEITGWTTEGQPLPNSICQCTTHSKAETLVQLDKAIAFCKRQIQEIEKGADYYKMGEDVFKSKNRRIAQFLSLPIDLAKLAKPYIETKIKL
jgi:hypothetical protein